MRTQMISNVFLMRLACRCSLCVFLVDVQAWAEGDDAAVTPEDRRKGYQRLHNALQDKPHDAYIYIYFFFLFVSCQCDCV